MDVHRNEPPEPSAFLSNPQKELHNNVYNSSPPTSPPKKNIFIRFDYNKQNGTSKIRKNNNCMLNGRVSLTSLKPEDCISKASKPKNRIATTPLVKNLFHPIFSDIIPHTDPDRRKKRKSKKTSKRSLCNGKNNNMKLKNKSTEKDENLDDGFIIGTIDEKTFFAKAKNKFCDVKLGDFVAYRNTNRRIILKIITLWKLKSTDDVHLHGAIMIRSSDTILGDSGHDELFATGNCISGSVSNIASILKVKENAKETTKEDCEYVYNSRKYIKRLVRFEKVPENFDSAHFSQCPFCEKTAASLNHPIVVQDEFSKYVSWKNHKYYPGVGVFLPPNIFGLDYYPEQFNRDEEFVYDAKLHTEYYRTMDDEGNQGSLGPSPIPYSIGLIEKIRAISKDNWTSPEDIYLYVNVMARPENVFSEIRLKHPNEVYWTPRKKLIKFCEVVGPCNIVYGCPNTKSKIFDHTYACTFYLSYGYDFSKNTRGVVPQEVVRKLSLVTRDTRKSLPVKNPLKSLDLFSGCGGLSYGLAQTGYVETKWAVESDADAAETFRENFPRAKVFEEDVNAFLIRAMQNKPGLPKRGEVDVIQCGPPCQGYSLLNRYKTTSEKSVQDRSLIIATLSALDFYKPRLFLMENVPNIVNSESGALIKRILRAMLDMQYQCTFAILECGQYGVPQSRKRLFLLAARWDCALPHFPEPTHSFDGKGLSVAVDARIYRFRECGASFARRRCTVYDAICDLPPLRNDEGEEEVPVRRLRGRPKTEYQRFMRRSRNGALRNHETVPLGPIDFARACHVPKLRGADWRYLPNAVVELCDGTVTEVLKYVDGKKSVCSCSAKEACDSKYQQINTLIPWFLSHTAKNNNNWAGVIGRVGWDENFHTTLTRPNITGVQGRVLHPSQDRIFSIREMARSQGIPDDFVFYGNLDSQYKQVGNAVPPPVAFAIGNEIGKAFFSASLEVVEKSNGRFFVKYKSNKSE